MSRTLLREALVKSGTVAIALVVIRTRQSVGRILRSHCRCAELVVERQSLQ